MESPPRAWGGAAFLHNVIIVHPRFTIDAGNLIMHYNATLCKEAWEKNYWRKLRSVRVFSKNCANNFFWSVGKGGAFEMQNFLLLRNEIRYSRYWK